MCLSKSVESDYEYIHAHVMNRRGNGKSIEIHCWSGDDDLGNHVVQDGDEIQWSFHENVFQSTLFHCDLKWDESNQFGFDAYRSNRDDKGRCSFGEYWKKDYMDTTIWELFYMVGKEEKET
ncbi:Plant self-incompatibility S1 [Macleaya cordata]|uniref:S-protein homolog n=1 Tax=Macleaya cordata TaxID=56857 RepID=A0A200RBY8_MACCD|nr:Plant self-incompatibility S1 [Macleaya cordata]